MMLQTIVYGGIVPGAVALVTMATSRWLLPTNLRQRYVAAIAASLGLLAGYGLLPAWAPWQPTTYWHWLPYLGLIAGLLGPLTLAGGVQWVERFLVRASLALLAAWFLVPTWARLEPVRAWHVLALAAYLLVLIVSLEPLTSRMSPARLLFPFCLAAIAVSVMTAAALSLRFGQLGGVVAASLAGTCVAVWIIPGSARELTLRGLVPWYVVLVGGLAYIGYINPEPRLSGLVVLPAAPLVLWGLAAGPLGQPTRSQWTARTTWLVETAAVLVPIAAAVAWILVATA